MADNEDEDLKNAVNAIGENIELYTQIQENPEGVVDANTNTLVELGEYQEDAEPDVKVDAIIKKAMETRTLTRKEQEERDAALAAEGKSWQFWAVRIVMILAILVVVFSVMGKKGDGEEADSE